MLATVHSKECASNVEPAVYLSFVWCSPGYTMQWLEAIDSALLKHNCTLTAGGYTHRGWLHSVKLQSLTHARVAPDYYGWRAANGTVTNNGDYWNWAVGPHALLAWAVGLWSYKVPTTEGRLVYGCLNLLSLFRTHGTVQPQR